MSSVENLERLMNYEKHPELVDLVQSCIPITSMNGVNQVPNDFIKKCLETDHTVFALTFIEQSKKQERATWGNPIFSMHFKKAVLNELSKVNYDFNSKDSTWEEYLAGVKMLGFEEVLRFEGDETELMFKHNEHTIIWIIKSYTYENVKEVSSTNIYLNFTIKKGMSDNRNVPFGRHYQCGTNIVSASLSMRDMPSYYLTEIFSNYEIVDYWVDNTLHSENLCTEKELSKLDNLTLDKLYSRVVRNVNLRDLDEMPFVLKTSFFNKVSSFYKGLSEEDRKHTIVYGAAMEGRFTDNSYISDSLISKALEYGFSQNDIIYLSAQIIYLIDDENNENPWNNTDNWVNVLTASELKKLMIRVESEQNDYSSFNFKPELREAINQKIALN